MASERCASQASKLPGMPPVRVAPGPHRLEQVGDRGWPRSPSSMSEWPVSALVPLATTRSAPSVERASGRVGSRWCCRPRPARRRRGPASASAGDVAHVEARVGRRLQQHQPYAVERRVRPGGRAPGVTVTPRGASACRRPGPGQVVPVGGQHDLVAGPQQRRAARPRRRPCRWRRSGTRRPPARRSRPRAAGGSSCRAGRTSRRRRTGPVVGSSGKVDASTGPGRNGWPGHRLGGTPGVDAAGRVAVARHAA